jgi:hypothetical protein
MDVPARGLGAILSILLAVASIAAFLGSHSNPRTPAQASARNDNGPSEMSHTNLEFGIGPKPTHLFCATSSKLAPLQ